MYVKSIYSYSSHTAFSKALGDNNFSQAEKFRRPCVMGRGNGKGKGVEEQSNKNEERKACSQKGDVYHTNSSMYFFL